MTHSLVRDTQIGQFPAMAPPRQSQIQPSQIQPSQIQPSQIQLSQAELSHIVSGTVRDADRWLSLVRYDEASRWYARLELTDSYEVWLLSWLPSQQTGFHDHGSSAGAFAVTLGSLSERHVHAGRPAPSGRSVTPGSVRTFGPRYLHDVRNDGPRPAVSIHAYSPPLSSMRRFQVGADGRLRATSEERSW
jgi:predicted metal-dependent enzyme (double-stranded beta helix superfamily)